MLKISRTVVLAILAPLLLTAQTQDDFQQDFDMVHRVINARYAYMDTKATSWADVPRLYAEDLKRVKTRDEFIALLEDVLDELYDPHMQLTANLAASRRLVPSGTDLWAEWRNGQAVITDVRANSDAQRAGIKANDVVLSVDNTPIGMAVEARLGRSYSHSTVEARDWALRVVLAGRHNTRRLLEIRQNDSVRKVELAAPDQFGTRSEPVSHSQIVPGIGYIRFNDSLGDTASIPAFDRALAELRDTRGLIIDLRETPGGGNSMVARGILGRFVTREQPYQKHAIPMEERNTGIRRSWLELVTPRGPFTYQKPVVVLAGHWTGSMGEGLTIGFDATRTATVVGTAMAGLLGATNQIMLPRTRIGLNLPVERLYHVEGAPREVFSPKVLVDVTTQNSDADPFIASALRVLPQR
jgi:C-terminal processing protease CtpA/Prc